MARPFPLLSAVRSTVLLLALLAAWPSASPAKTPLVNVIAADRGEKLMEAPAAPTSDSLSEARVQLRQAIHARDETGGSASERQRHPLEADRQRLLDWLVDLQREKVKRLEELDALQSLAKSPVGADPLVLALQGPPPYSAILVDALRDEIDGLREKLAAAEANHRANQTELQNLQDQLKARAAVVRRARESSLASGTVGKEAHAHAQAEHDIARLLERAAEVEISVTVLDQQRLSLQMAVLRSRIEAMQAMVAEVLHQQRLSTEDIAAQRQRILREEARLAGKIRSIGRRNSLHRAERERLGDSPASGQKAAYLDATIKTENAMLKGLALLQTLNGVSGDAWEKCYILITSTEPDQRRAALDALNELRQKLADWRSLSRARQDALHTDIRAQHVRLDNLAGDQVEQGREKQLLSLLLEQTAIDERTELAAARLERRVTRWLDDLARPGDPGWRGQVARFGEQAEDLLKRVWQQELFVAEDVSEVDGHKVSVKYGVTVGKSVGLILVFLAGYWLLARISRFIQNRLVRWFKISPQFASVLRRWSMIGLSFAFVVLLLNLARIPLSVFAFAGGALAIGVGFGAQTIIKNFISGLIVLIERKVRVGDVVELGGISGYVTAVDLRATTVRAFNGVEALIPNANFIENQVINWTYSNRRVRRELAVGVAYGTDMDRVEDLFLAAAAAHASVLRNPTPEVFFEDFGDSALKAVLIYWVEFDGTKGPRRVDSDLRHEIYALLADAGISIPFPQRDVHVSLAQPIALSAASPEPCHAS